jgi:1,4-dihydroxy-2-naphthoate octaprenyltransferase
MIKLLILYIFVNIVVSAILYTKLKRPYSVSDIVAFIMALFFGTLILIVSLIINAYERYLHNT